MSNDNKDRVYKVYEDGRYVAIKYVDAAHVAGRRGRGNPVPVRMPEFDNLEKHHLHLAEPGLRKLYGSYLKDSTSSPGF